MLSVVFFWIFKRNLKGLGSISTISVIVVSLTCISLVITSLCEIGNGNWAHEPDTKPIWGFERLAEVSFWKKDFWITAPAFGFVFSGLLELFEVFNDLQQRNVKRAKREIVISTIICCTLYVLVGVAVVIRYGQNTIENSLYNVPGRLH